MISLLVDVLRLLIEGLTKIDDGFDPLVIMNIIELKYLEYLGVMPIIDACAICGSKQNIKTLQINTTIINNIRNNKYLS